MRPAVTEYFDRSFGSDDIEETEQWLAAAYGSVSLDPRFARYEERTVGDPRFALSTVRMLGTYSCDVDPDLVHAATATGGFRWEAGRDVGSLSAEPAVFRPGHPYRATTSDTDNLVVRLSTRDLQRTARLLYAQDDLEVRFEGTRPATPAAGAQWRAVVTDVSGLVTEGMLQHDLLRATTYRLLAITALESFRLVGDRRELRSSAERRQHVYRRGAAFLQDFASLPITIDDAAEAAGASAGELTRAFSAHAPDEQSPTGYLRRVRLDAALRDLRVGDPTRGDTVQAIALRWGFSSPSRFAQQFRAAFGVNPRQVLDG